MDQRQAARRQNWLGYGACALAGCLWGTGFFFGKLALREMSVGHMVLYRFLWASLGMLPLIWTSRRNNGKDALTPKWTGREIATLLLSSFLGIPVQFLLQFKGLSLTTVSHASLMVGTMPVLLALGATLFANERLDWLGWLALAGSTLGAGLIVLGGRDAGVAGVAPSLGGDLLVVASLILSLGWILLNKSLMEIHGPLAVTAWGILTGTAMLAAWVVATEGLPPVRLSATAWFALTASGIFCTAATTLLWNWGIHHVPASRAGVFLNIEPALGSILGVELLGDRLGPFAWVGGGLILAAAVTLTARGHDFDPEVLLE